MPPYPVRKLQEEQGILPSLGKSTKHTVPIRAQQDLDFEPTYTKPTQSDTGLCIALHCIALHCTRCIVK